METKNKSILFLHGFLGSSQDLVELMGLCQQRGLQTYSFNFSGHGKNAAEPTEFRIDLFARDLEAYIKSHNLKNLIVFGYSMGGYVALYHKAHYEDSPLSMIFTYGTKFNWSSTVVNKELPMMDPEYLLEKFPHLAQSLESKHGERWKQLLRSSAHLMQNLERLDGLTREDLSGINIPVTLILGDQDRVVTTEETHLTGSWISRSQFKTISYSKHELERTNLREIVDIIAENIE
jgi:pimeloyl-ACP methyl ester carboxylesterase